MLLYWIILPIVWVLAHLIWRIEVVGREHYDAVHDGRALVIASNHICNLDPVYIAIALMDWRRMCILAKEELFQNPFIGWFLGGFDGFLYALVVCAAWAQCPSTAARATPPRSTGSPTPAAAVRRC